MRRVFAIVSRSIAIRAAALAPAVVFVACADADDHTSQPRVVVAGASIQRGQQLVTSHNCIACHTIDGLSGATGRVGPPLTGFANRVLIAGELANQPDNLVRWIMTPSAVEPRTVMPNMGLTSDEARDVAGYLYTLK